MVSKEIKGIITDIDANGNVHILIENVFDIEKLHIGRVKLKQ